MCVETPADRASSRHCEVVRQRLAVIEMPAGEPVEHAAVAVRARRVTTERSWRRMVKSSVRSVRE
jgi:hypothetical protein